MFSIIFSGANVLRACSNVLRSCIKKWIKISFEAGDVREDTIGILFRSIVIWLTFCEHKRMIKWDCATVASCFVWCAQRSFGVSRQTFPMFMRWLHTSPRSFDTCSLLSVRSVISCVTANVTKVYLYENKWTFMKMNELYTMKWSECEWIAPLTLLLQPFALFYEKKNSLLHSLW